jgi:Bcr/CflA subfamily drug resistance transporter
MNQLKLSKIQILLYVLFTIPIAGMSIDIYVPSLPSVLYFFHTTPVLVKWTLSIFLLGHATSQLLWGPLSDSIGRRKVLLFCISLFIVASFLAAKATSIHALLIWRLIQGLGTGGLSTLSRAILSDTFEGAERKKAITYMATAWGIGPIIAPAIGGYLQTYFGWQANFYLLAAYMLVNLTIAFFFFPETHFKRHAFHFSIIKNNFKLVLSHLVFINIIIILAMGYSVSILFNVVGPFLVQVVYHFSSLQYGYLALALGLVFFSGNLLNRFLIVRFSLNALLTSSILLIGFGSVLMLVLALAGFNNIYALVIPAFIVFFASAISGSNAMAYSAMLFPEIAGAASAVMGSAFVLLTAIISAVGGLLKTHHILPLAISYLVFFIVAVISLRLIHARSDSSLH